MKKILLILMSFFLLVSCSSKKDYVLNEDNFFLVMTNMLYYPEQYKSSTITYDAFMYDLEDTSGTIHKCSVRKCSSGFGCTCGNDTIIGFILNYDQELPEAKNQSEDTVEKTWVHVKGKLHSYKYVEIEIYSYTDGVKDLTKTEKIKFLIFDVEEISLITDYFNLKYYVTR